MSRRRPVLPALCAALLLSLCALPARAQNPAAAEALFEQARAAMAAGSYDIACARFRDSDKLDPAVGTRFNLADCEEKRGRVATAWSLFRGVLAEVAQDDDRRPIAEARAAKLQPRLPFVTLVVTPETPSGVRVRIDGVELTEGSFGVPLPMDPGSHDLSLAWGDQGAERRRTFTIREGERSEVPLRIDAKEQSAQAAPEDDAPLIVTTGPSRRKWGYVAGSVGVASLAFGTVTGVITLSKKSTASANCSESLHLCNQAGVDANESGKTFAALSTLGFGLGIVGLGTGAYLLLTSPPAKAHAAHPSTPTSRMSVHADLALAEGRGFVSLAGRF